MRFKDFKKLSTYNKKILKKQKYLQKKESKETIPASKSDMDLFHQAMQDVEPLKDNGHGRKVTLQNNDHKIPSPEPSSKERARQYLQDLIQGKLEFEIDDTNEYLQGNVKGLDPRIFRKLKTAQYSPEAHLDLHGQTLEFAQENFLRFIKDNYLNGKRCLLIVTGRGKNSPHGRSIIREEVHRWLTKDPLKRIVLAFSTAQPQHGGPGALYILLRKYKKSRGKIFWEKYLIDHEL